METEKFTTTHDIEANGVRYIMEWTHTEDGTDHISITEACDGSDDNEEEPEGCMHETYDFTEFIG